MTDYHSLPPSTALLNDAINDPAIGDSEFRTYSRLYALAWRHDYRHTDPLDYQTEIIPLIGSHGAARRHMNSLRAAGYLDWTTNGAHQYVFTFPSPKSGTCEPEKQPPTADPSPTNGTPGTTFGTQSADPSPKSGTSSTKSGTPSPKNGTREPFFEAPVPVGTVPTEDRVGEDRLINLINLNTYPILPSDARLEKILVATQILFAGESLYRPQKQITFHTLLAHLAQAYHEKQRGERGSPVRMVFNRIRRGWKPEPAYLSDPFAFLPAGFLSAAGLDAFIRAAAVEEPDADPAPEDRQPAELDPSVLQPIRPAGPTPAQAWESVRQQLRQEMPRSAFEQWVQSARLLRYVDGNFQIGAPTELARDWLHGRLASVVTRQLAGVCNRSVAVCFVVEGR